MRDPNQVFSQFPKFTNLTYAHRDAWNELIADYPAMSEFSFGTLMNWWSTLEPCKIAILNNNIVISYWMPGDAKNSGLSILGVHRIDESVCTIFDWQKENGYEPKLVHVPEFVVESMRYADLFSIDPDRSYDECLIDTEKFSDINSVPIMMRRRIRKFFTNHNEENLQVRTLDLEDPFIKQELMDLNEVWKHQNGFNQLSLYEHECFSNSIQKAYELGYFALGFYLNGQLNGCLIYQEPKNTEYRLINYARFDYSIPCFYEAAVFQASRWFQKHKVKYVNIDGDFDDNSLRINKIILGVRDFYRKYNIRPLG